MAPRPGRVAGPTTTALGDALRAKRGETTASAVASQLGVDTATMTRIELGARPSFDTALKLARWLGEDWNVERVMEAAKAAGGAP
jgi:transcriptional regulator with XRE-family HTH domain